MSDLLFQGRIQIVNVAGVIRHDDDYWYRPQPAGFVAGEPARSVAECGGTEAEIVHAGYQLATWDRRTATKWEQPRPDGEYEIVEVWPVARRTAPGWLPSKLRARVQAWLDGPHYEPFLTEETPDA